MLQGRPLPDPVAVAAPHDRLAREHPIDDYYARSPLPVRLIERERLAIIREMMGEVRGLEIAEIGSGGGHVLRMFPGAKITAIDVSDIYLDTARKNLAGYDARFVKGEVDKLDLPANGFDRIICTEVLEHTVDPFGNATHTALSFSVPAIGTKSRTFSVTTTRRSAWAAANSSGSGMLRSSGRSVTATASTPLRRSPAAIVGGYISSSSRRMQTESERRPRYLSASCARRHAACCRSASSRPSCWSSCCSRDCAWCSIPG